MGLELPIHTWGRGPVRVLFLHGFGGNGQAFDHLDPLLGDLISVIAPDLPGHNGAPLPDSLDRSGFMEAIGALDRLIDADLVVAGYSQGARLALSLACLGGAVPRALILESGSPGIHRAREREARLKLDDQRASTIESIGVEGFMDGWEKLPMFEGLRRLPEDTRSGLRRRRTGHSPSGLAGAFRALGTATQPSNWSCLPHLTMPVLILTGSRDRKFSRIGARMRHRIPNARQASLRGSWHAPHLERPEQYASEIRRFLEGLNASSK